MVRPLRSFRVPLRFLAFGSLVALTALAGLPASIPGATQPAAAHHIPTCPTSAEMNLEAATVWWMGFFHGPETATLEDVRWPECTLVGAFRFSGPMTLDDGNVVYVYRGAGVCVQCDADNLI